MAAELVLLHLVVNVKCSILAPARSVARRQDKGITELLMAPGELASEIQGISGTRNLSDNLSDLKAQAIPS